MQAQLITEDNLKHNVLKSDAGAAAAAAAATWRHQRRTDDLHHFAPASHAHQHLKNTPVISASPVYSMCLCANSNSHNPADAQLVKRLLLGNSRHRRQ